MLAQNPEHVKLTHGGRRAGAGLHGCGITKTNISVSVTAKVWETALAIWQEKPSRLVDRLVKDYVKSGGCDMGKGDNIMNHQLEIKIDAPRLTADKFQEAVHKFVTLLKGVAKNATGKYAPEDWGIEVAGGGAVMTVRTDSQENARTTDAIACGFRSLMIGLQTIPKYFTKDEVEAARDIASLIDADGRFVKAIYIQNGGAPIGISPQVVKTADLILTGEKQTAFGAMEGMIESLQRKEDHPITCTVKDAIHDRSILCTFNTPECEEEAFQAFKLARRVLVWGLISYTKERYPVRIDSNLIRAFPPESDLPTLEEIHAFQPNIGF